MINSTQALKELERRFIDSDLFCEYLSQEAAGSGREDQLYIYRVLDLFHPIPETEHAVKNCGPAKKTDLICEIRGYMQYIQETPELLNNKKKENNMIEIFIIIRGGVVQEVYSTLKLGSAEVIDIDNDECDETSKNALIADHLQSRANRGEIHQVLE